jgi:hypothetical protein
LRPHPADHLVEQQRHEEHPLRVAEMGNREDRDPRLAVRGVEHLLNVERIAGHPRVEAGRGQEVVDGHREAEAFFRRVERLEVEHADAGHRRRLDLLDQGGQIHILAGAPRGVEECREQDMVAALHRVGLDAEQAEEARHGSGHALAERLALFGRTALGRGERVEYRHRQPGLAPRRVDDDVG